MTYIAKDGTESARSSVLKVTVSPLPQVKAANSGGQRQGEKSPATGTSSHSNSTGAVTLSHTNTTLNSEKTGHASTTSTGGTNSSKAGHTL